MGVFDFLTSTKRPDKGIAVLSKTQVREKIMSANRVTAPFHIIDGAEEKVDLIAEWKIVDVTWYEIFGKAGLKKVFRIYLKLDETKNEVRAVDREYSVEWHSGIPSLSLSVEAFRGQKQEISFGSAYAFTEEGKPGEVYKYKFSTNEIKTPIQDAVTSCGWTYKGVAFGKL